MKTSLVIASLLVSSSLFAQQDFSKVEIRSQQVAGAIHMLTGAGGNIGVVVGDDGVFMIDDQYAPLTPKIQAAIAQLTDKPVRFVINTHWHGDHTGGNENMGAAGAIIVAHENVRVRMSSEQFNPWFKRTTPPSPRAALPVVTFGEGVTFHLNGQTIEASHVENAHTDGDSVIWFREANVVHTGDLFFNGFYPFIDTASGGSVNGIIAAVDQLLARVNASTKIIPGHGPLASVADLRAYREMLGTARDRLARLAQQGKTRQEVLELNPLGDLDAKWGKGFMNTEAFTSIAYDDIASSRPMKKKK